MDKKKVLFMPGSFSLAHVGRLVTLAKALPPEDYEVTFACEERDHRFIPSAFRRLHATSLQPDDFRRRLEKGQPLIEAAFLRTQVEEDLILLQRVHPHLVVGDFRPSLSISASLAKVPYLNVVNALWSPWYKESPQLPSLLDIAPLKYLGPQWGGQLMDKLIPLGLWMQSRPFNKIRKEYKLPPLPYDLRSVYTAADYTAYPDLPELFPTPGAPRTHKHIGPVLWEPNVPLPEWWSSIPQDKPWVYVTAGSTGQTNCLEAIMEALADLPVVVVVATAGRTSIRSVPERVYTADYLPGQTICEQASLVVNNGGSGGVYQALAAGVPVLGIAANMDQCLVMKSLARTGAGKMVMVRETKGYAWKEALSDLFNSQKAKTAARILSQKLNRTSGEDNFRFWVDQIVGVTKRISHQHPAIKQPEVESLSPSTRSYKRQALIMSRPFSKTETLSRSTNGSDFSTEISSHRH